MVASVAWPRSTVVASVHSDCTGVGLSHERSESRGPMKHELEGALEQLYCWYDRNLQRMTPEQQLASSRCLTWAYQLRNNLKRRPNHAMTRHSMLKTQSALHELERMLGRVEQTDADKTTASGRAEWIASASSRR